MSCTLYYQPTTYCCVDGDVDFGVKVGVGVDCGVGIDVKVGVGVDCGVGIDVKVGVDVDCGVGVDVGVGVGVEVAGVGPVSHIDPKWITQYKVNSERSSDVWPILRLTTEWVTG